MIRLWNPIKLPYSESNWVQLLDHLLDCQNPMNYIFSFVILTALIPGVGSQLKAEGSTAQASPPMYKCHFLVRRTRLQYRTALGTRNTIYIA